jgi:hypothetical protein
VSDGPLLDRKVQEERSPSANKGRRPLKEVMVRIFIGKRFWDNGLDFCENQSHQSKLPPFAVVPYLFGIKVIGPSWMGRK